MANAAEHLCEVSALLGEGLEVGLDQLAVGMLHRLEPVAICDQFIHLLLRKSKHELIRESLNVSPYLFIKPKFGSSFLLSMSYSHAETQSFLELLVATMGGHDSPNW